jgi:hypothetical protein
MGLGPINDPLGTMFKVTGVKVKSNDSDVSSWFMDHYQLITFPSPGIL